MYQDSMQYPTIMLMPLPLPSKWQKCVQSSIPFNVPFLSVKSAVFLLNFAKHFAANESQSSIVQPCFLLKYAEMFTQCSCLNYQYDRRKIIGFLHYILSLLRSTLVSIVSSPIYKFSHGKLPSYRWLTY
jgi:hypothetical protein